MNPDRIRLSADTVTHESTVPEDRILFNPSRSEEGSDRVEEVGEREHGVPFVSVLGECPLDGVYGDIPRHVTRFDLEPSRGLAIDCDLTQIRRYGDGPHNRVVPCVVPVRFRVLGFTLGNQTMCVDIAHTDHVILFCINHCIAPLFVVVVGDHIALCIDIVSTQIDVISTHRYQTVMLTFR